MRKSFPFLEIVLLIFAGATALYASQVGSHPPGFEGILFLVAAFIAAIAVAVHGN